MNSKNASSEPAHNALGPHNPLKPRVRPSKSMASTTDPFENAMQPHPGHLLLRTLEESDADALERAVASWPPGENTVFAPGFRRGEDFAGYVALLEAQARGERLPERWVPSLTMFGFVGGTIVGRLQLRMHLNDFLLRVGGGQVDITSGKYVFQCTEAS